ncbi:glycine cleavage system protein H [Lactiplantibacillus sp. WILCCON 0030]|uniref:Glycine cleavage system protein H n=1 Tax=Lactiplantibacillus brownii TaxID=3069269 RepID=A0ABU1A5M7_9LACO|nr:glycine cleavage system protein H [Lactiplantibacillus brownii]MDQ7936287.1 glycine cleavage system protein H [Lactiplantibacillus brownii]
MPEHQSVWKTMIQYYQDEHQAIHAPMVYGDIWVRTKSRQRLVFGLTADAQAALGTVTAIDYPALNTHLEAGEILLTITGTNMTKQLATPFSVTVQKLNTDLADNPQLITDNIEKDNWLSKLRAD